jgi:hypothetical protein
MLTNFQLEDLCRYYAVPLVGCFMKNELPKAYKEGNYIINLDSAPSVGDHWVSMRIKNKQGMYCDSFAGPPVEEAVYFVRQEKGTHLGYNNSVIQDFKSKNCGYYSFCFLLYTSKSTKPLYVAASEYISLFKDNTLDNDKILADTLCELIAKSGKKMHPLIQRLCKEKCVS